MQRLYGRNDLTMDKFKLMFRDLDSKELIGKAESQVLPFATDLIMIGKQKFLVNSKIVNYDIRVAIVYGKVIEWCIEDFIIMPL